MSIKQSFFPVAPIRAETFGFTQKLHNVTQKHKSSVSDLCGLYDGQGDVLALESRDTQQRRKSWGLDRRT